MKKHEVHTLTELSIYTDCDNPENTVNLEIIKDPLVFKYHVEDRTSISLFISSADKDDSTLVASLRFDIDDMEHLHSWLGVLLRNKSEV